MKKILIILLCLITMFGCSKPTNNTNEAKKENQTDEVKETKITFFEGLQTSFYLTGENADKFIEYFNERESSSEYLRYNTSKFSFNFEGEDFHCYPFYDEIYFKSMQTQKLYVIEDRYIVSKIYSLMPVKFTETLQNKIEEQPIDIYGYDPAILTPITLDEGHVFKNENKNDMGSSGYTSIYLDYSCYLEIYNNQLVITDANTLESFIVNDIINPISIAYRGSCGGPLDMAVLTAQGEMYILDGFMYSYSNNKYTTSHNLDVLKVETDEIIKEIQIYDDINVFTTCGNARYYALTEKEELRGIGSTFDKVNYRITSYFLGRTRDEIHPYKDYLVVDDHIKSGKESVTNMFYHFKDNTLHTGYIIDEQGFETWNLSPVLDENGNTFYMDSCFQVYTSKEEISDFIIVGEDGYLYAFDYLNTNFKINPDLKLQKLSNNKVSQIQICNGDGNRTTPGDEYLIIQFEDGSENKFSDQYIDGMSYSKYLIE